MQVATLIIASASLAVSVSTLAIVIIGGRKVHEEMSDTKRKAAGVWGHLKTAVDIIEGNEPV